MLHREQQFLGSEGESFFLWGARQTGKSTLLREAFPDALWVDLLQLEVVQRLAREPRLFREWVLAQPEDRVIVVDEIQKIPELLNEIHSLMVNPGYRFVLSGSSARKINQAGVNLLGGRALRYDLLPLSWREIPDFDLHHALHFGLLPRHYLKQNPKKRLEAYVAHYLNEEILYEAKVRNIPGFTQFLRMAAFSNGELVNFTNIAADCGVSHTTVRSYFQILEDALVGRFLPAYELRPKRRTVQGQKFYYFDVGIANTLLKRTSLLPGTEEYGAVFEHFIYQELFAYSKYLGDDCPLYFWRTVGQLEVDFLLGDHRVAIEVKSTDRVQSKHLRGLKAFADEFDTQNLLLVSRDPIERKVGDIHVLPWWIFLQRLWSGDYRPVGTLSRG
jgi:predicted AAA+ superfamily ATPase